MPPLIQPTPLGHLEALHGLAKVEEQVRQIHAQVVMYRDTERAGLPVDAVNMNMVFYGNPGTGKTTVAKILARIFGDLGLLSGNNVREAASADLIADHIGGSAKKTKKLFEESLGGVLIVDEAYDLNPKKDDGRECPFRQEAINNILVWLSEYNREIAVIFAGYPGPMEKFLRANPGLAARIPHHLYFEDYDDEDLLLILQDKAAAADLTVLENAKRVILARFADCRRECAAEGKYFRNARVAQSLLEAADRARADRVFKKKPLSRNDLTVLAPEDFANAVLTRGAEGKS